MAGLGEVGKGILGQSRGRVGQAKEELGRKI